MANPEVLDMTPTGLVSLAASFDGQADDLGDALREAARKLTEIGDFWGDDAAGRKFFEGVKGKSGYRAVSTDIPDEVGALATAYVRIGDRLVIMGRNVGVANADTIAQLAGWASVADLPEVPR